MTDDVRLRAPTPADLPGLFANQSDPEAAELAGFPSRELDEFLEHRARIEADPSVQTRVIVVGEGGELVGDIGSWVAGGDRLVGYWIDRRYWGRGIATAALTAFLAEVTDRPVYAHVVKHNAPSLRVLEKCGFAIVRDHTSRDPDPADILLRLDADADRHRPRGELTRCREAD